MYKVTLTDKVEKFLYKQRGQRIIKDFYNAVTIIEKDPFNNRLDIKPYENTTNSYRLRLGKYRFLYEILKEEVIIEFYDADSRGGIY